MPEGTELANKHGSQHKVLPCGRPQNVLVQITTLLSFGRAECGWLASSRRTGGTSQRGGGRGRSRAWAQDAKVGGGVGLAAVSSAAFVDKGTSATGVKRDNGVRRGRGQLQGLEGPSYYSLHLPRGLTL